MPDGNLGPDWATGRDETEPPPGPRQVEPGALESDRFAEAGRRRWRRRRAPPLWS